MSAFLFNILAETITIELRSNLEDSFTVKNSKHNLNQYADDTGIYSFFTQKALDSIIFQLDSLQTHTGLKVNYDLLYDRTRSTIFHSKVQWHSEGEHNSSTYFFNLEKNRYNLKTCHTLLTDNGILIEDQKSILQAQEDFYRLLYKKDSNVRFRLVNSSGQHLTEELQELLNLPISFNEITAAVNFLQNPVL